MKRTLALLLVLMLAVGTLAGCQREEPDLTPTDPSTVEDNNQGGDTTTPDEPDTSSDTPLPEGEGTLRVAVNADISTLNGHMYSMSRDGDAADMLAIYLYRSYIGDDYKFTYLPEFAADVPQQMDDALSQSVADPPARGSDLGKTAIP